MVAIATALIGWIVWAVLDARGDLNEARQHAVQVKDALLRADRTSANNSLTAAIEAAGRAEERTHGAPLSWVADTPGIGSPLRTVQDMTVVVENLLTDVARPLVSSKLANVFATTGDQQLNVDALRNSTSQFNETAAAAAVIKQQAAAVPDTYLGVVDDARVQLQAQITALTDGMRQAAILSPSLPGILGGNGPRNYLLVFQTNAEARATGGLMGGTAILHADNGTLMPVDSTRNDEMRLDVKPIDLGPEFAANYGRWSAANNWQNANVSPHFPYAAQIWRSIWAQYSGTTVDGVIATDVVTLSYILESTGPITLPSGEVISADNVVDITLNQAYFRFPLEKDIDARKDYLQSISRGVIGALTSQQGSMSNLVEALGRASSEGRLSMWSANADEQADLAKTPLGHTVSPTAAPYANVIVNNGAGSKLDYYLGRDIKYTAGPCEGDTRKSTITVALTNNADEKDYPSYVGGRRTPETYFAGPPGTNRSILTIFTSPGAKFESMTVNGTPAFVLRSNELGHPAFSVPIVLKPHQSVTVTLALTEPTSNGPAIVPIQPLVLPPAVSVDVPTCKASN